MRDSIFQTTRFPTDEHARLLAVFEAARRAAQAEAEHGDDAEERDELYDREFARQLDVHGVTHEQARGVRVILRGCDGARRREVAADRQLREQAAAAERAASRQAERARTPDLFERNAIAVIGALTDWHIAFEADASGTLSSVAVQGWRATSRFVGKPQGEFYVLRWTRQDGRSATGEGTWAWPDAVEHVACMALASHSLKVRDAFIRAALQATAFAAMTDDDRRHRAALCSLADIADPAPFVPSIAA